MPWEQGTDAKGNILMTVMLTAAGGTRAVSKTTSLLPRAVVGATAVRGVCADVEATALSG